MKLSMVEEGGVRVVEGSDDEHPVDKTVDATAVLETCFSNGVRLVLLYGTSLPDAFFDLSSGAAGAILQRLRNYEVRLALVCPPDAVHFSSRFGEMVAEEERRDGFRVFETREAARRWLAGLPQT